MNDLKFLDVLTIVSFVIQMCNQLSITDIQHFVDDLQQHLEAQDTQLKQIMEVLNENHQKDL